MADWAFDWSPSDIAGNLFTYADGQTVLDLTDKPAGATAALVWPGKTDADFHVANQSQASTQVSTTVTLSAAGTVSFYRRASSESGWDGLRFYVDGVQQDFYSGTVAWGQVSYSLAAGSHTLAWAYTKDGSGDSGNDDAAIALLAVTNCTSPTYGDPRTATLYDFEGGTIPACVSTTTWAVSGSEPISGSKSLRSPSVTADSATYSATINPGFTSGPGVVMFDWKVSSEGGSDKFSISTSSVARNILLGSGTASGTACLIVAAGATVGIAYIKDNSFSAGSDAAWIDNLAIYAPSGATSQAGAATLTSTSTLTASASLAMAHVFDDFNRADTVDGLGTSSSGAIWAPTSGEFSVSANRAVAKGSSTFGCLVLNTGTPDHYAQATIVQLGYSPASLAFRVANASNSYWMAYWGDSAPANNHYSLWKVDAGSYSTVWYSSSRTPVDGDVVRVECSGASITLKVNGETLVTLTGQTFNQSATAAGLRGNGAGSPGSIFDDFDAGENTVGPSATLASTSTLTASATLARAASATLAATAGLAVTGTDAKPATVTMAATSNLSADGSIGTPTTQGAATLTATSTLSATVDPTTRTATATLTATSTLTATGTVPAAVAASATLAATSGLAATGTDTQPGTTVGAAATLISQARFSAEADVITPVAEPPDNPAEDIPPERQPQRDSGYIPWGSDVRISMPRPLQGKPELAVPMQGFIFTVDGLRHDLTQDDWERLMAPDYGPADPRIIVRGDADL